MDKVLIEPFQNFISKIASFLPNLMIGLIIIALGFLIAWVFKIMITRTSRILKMDRLSEKVGISQIIQKSGMRESFSGIIGGLVYWIILLSFLIMGLDAFKIPAVENLLSEFWRYLPNVITATIILVIGYLLGNFLGRAALIASVNAGLAVSSLIGKFVKFTVFVMAATMALEMLGIGKDTVLIAFAVVFGGVVLALAIAFGLGGKDATKDYIDKMLKEKKEEDDIQHI